MAIVFPLVLFEAQETEEGIRGLEAACRTQRFDRGTCERYALWAEMARAILHRHERRAEEVQARLAAQHHGWLVRELQKSESGLFAVALVDWETNALAEIGRKRGMLLDTLSRRFVTVTGGVAL